MQTLAASLERVRPLEEPAKILVADDSSSTRSLIRDLLVLEGHEVVVAENGVQALERAAETHPDLIMLDIVMPEMDGFLACKHLKGDEETQSTPVVLVTSLQDTEDRKKGLEMGADDFISKPFSRYELCARVANLIQGKRRRDQLIEAEELRTRMITMVAHDLKNFLYGIVLHVENIEKAGDPKGTVKKSLKSILSGGEQMQVLVSNLLQFHQLEEGRLTLELGRVNLESMVASCIEEASERAKRRTFVKNGIFPDVTGDAARIRQILNNLLTNAVKYSPNGGPISVTGTGAAESATISVEDQGMGVADVDKNDLFQPFYRSKDPRVMALPGTGLGLSIVRVLVELHGGKIRHSDPPSGKGAIFSFTLPLAKGE
ncbi:MAG: hybrid sensor histidine kinase/response regulator [Armatimonadetes bacterium]|nr:hybrid sensor histidine kinase/response regulator [Armatimonadota bacterium]